MEIDDQSNDISLAKNISDMTEEVQATIQEFHSKVNLLKSERDSIIKGYMEEKTQEKIKEVRDSIINN